MLRSVHLYGFYTCDASTSTPKHARRSIDSRDRAKVLKYLCAQKYDYMRATLCDMQTTKPTDHIPTPSYRIHKKKTTSNLWCAICSGAVLRGLLCAVTALNTSIGAHLTKRRCTAGWCLLYIYTSRRTLQAPNYRVSRGANIHSYMLMVYVWWFCAIRQLRMILGYCRVWPARSQPINDWTKKTAATWNELRGPRWTYIQWSNFKYNSDHFYFESFRPIRVWYLKSFYWLICIGFCMLT